MLDEEMDQRNEDLEIFTVTIETEVQERIFHDHKLTTVVNEETDNAMYAMVVYSSISSYLCFI